MVFKATPEQQRVRDLIAPLYTVGAIEYSDVFELVGKEISRNQLRSWKSRELKKSVEDQEIRLLKAKLRLESTPATIPATATATDQEISENIATIEQAPATATAQAPATAQAQTAVVAENTYDYINKLGINGLCDEIIKLQAVTVANLFSETKRITKIEKYCDRLLKAKDNTPQDIKSIMSTVEKCIELKRKIALMPYGSIDPNKQLATATAQAPALHFHSHGTDYKPTS